MSTKKFECKFDIGDEAALDRDAHKGRIKKVEIDRIQVNFYPASPPFIEYRLKGREKDWVGQHRLITIPEAHAMVADYHENTASKIRQKTLEIST